MPTLPVKLNERFWRKVDKTEGCWNWTASDNGVGYGMFWYPERQKRLLAHRLSYESVKGPIPDGLFVMHLCDNPRCVNPEHLQAGTHTENMRDCIAKGRFRFCHRRGEQNGRSTYTERQIRRVGLLYELGLKRSEIIKITGVSRDTVKDVRHGRTWAHLQVDGGGYQ